VSREDGGYYERSWQGAISAAPDWIVINSFNEWYEGDYIEPSQAYGSRYLQLTSTWAAAFHNASPPPVQPTATATVAVAPTVAPAATTAPEEALAATAATATVAPAPTAAPRRPKPTPVPADPPERKYRMGPHGPWAE
jgi:hypothetical protein